MFLLAQEIILSFKERTVQLNGFYIRQSDFSPPKPHKFTFTAAEEKPEAGWCCKGSKCQANRNNMKHLLS